MFLLVVELGRNKRHSDTPPGYDKAQVARQRDRAVGRGQPGLTGPQRGRGQEGEVGALSQGSPEGSARVSSAHCFCQDCLLVCV